MDNSVDNVENKRRQVKWTLSSLFDALMMTCELRRVNYNVAPAEQLFPDKHLDKYIPVLVAFRNPDARVIIIGIQNIIAVSFRAHPRAYRTLHGGISRNVFSRGPESDPELPHHIKGGTIGR